MPGRAASEDGDFPVLREFVAEFPNHSCGEFATTILRRMLFFYNQITFAIQNMFCPSSIEILVDVSQISVKER